MSVTYLVKKKLLLFLFVLEVWSFDSMAQRTDEKTKYIGIYESNMNFMNPTDTLSATIFFTHDSFLLVFMIRNDSDYRYPLCKGIWTLTTRNETDDAELKYNNGVSKTGVFEESEISYNKSICFRFGDIRFCQPERRLIRTKNLRK